MRYYKEMSVIQNGADPKDVGIDLGGKIIVGKFVDIERPTFSDLQAEVLKRAGKQ
jgi:2-oxoglutarate ferredoxin oxidoreductase subunit beta